MHQQVDPLNEYDQLARRRRGFGSPESQRLFASILCSIIALATCSYIFWITAVSAHNIPQTMHVPNLKSSLMFPATATPIVNDRPSVDNIACQTNEQVYYHVHVHLTLVIKGNPVIVPANVGIAYDKKCLYWLHTHDRSGVIHVESPKKDLYTLGTFLHLWKKQFADLGYPPELDQQTGWQIYVNGGIYRGDFHAIPLVSHTLITLAYRTSDVEPDSDFLWGTLTR